MNSFGQPKHLALSACISNTIRMVQLLPDIVRLDGLAVVPRWDGFCCLLISSPNQGLVLTAMGPGFEAWEKAGCERGGHTTDRGTAHLRCCQK